MGTSGFVVDVSFYYLFQLFGLPHELARALSFWPAVSWNWAMNRTTTFSERVRRPRVKQWIEFAMLSLLGFCFSWGTYVTLTANVGFFDRYRLLALICGVGVASVLNFTASTLFVYSDKRGHAEKNRITARNGVEENG